MPRKVQRNEKVLLGEQEMKHTTMKCGVTETMDWNTDNAATDRTETQS